MLVAGLSVGKVIDILVLRIRLLSSKAYQYTVHTYPPDTTVGTRVSMQANRSAEAGIRHKG